MTRDILPNLSSPPSPAPSELASPLAKTSQAIPNFPHTDVLAEAFPTWNLLPAVPFVRRTKR